MADVQVAIADGVATLTLDRPQALNALSVAMTEGINAFVAQVEHDPAVRVVVIRGAGDHFMAGGDLKFFHEQFGMPADERRAKFETFIHAAHVGVRALRRMGKPVIASVQGACAGYGLSLVLAADLAVAADNAYFTLAYINIATSPDGGSTWHLPRAVGQKKAAEIALLGDRFDANAARDIGLVNRVVPLGELEGATTQLARRLAAGPALAIARTKALLNASLQRDFEEQMAAEAVSFAASTTTADMREGLEAFLGKRKPAFKGA